MSPLQAPTIITNSHSADEQKYNFVRIVGRSDLHQTAKQRKKNIISHVGGAWFRRAIEK